MKYTSYIIGNRVFINSRNSPKKNENISGSDFRVILKNIW